MKRHWRHDYAPKPRCGICSHVIDGAFVRHHGRRCHPQCWHSTGETPDIVAGRGEYEGEAA